MTVTCVAGLGQRSRLLQHPRIRPKGVGQQHDNPTLAQTRTLLLHQSTDLPIYQSTNHLPHPRLLGRRQEACHPEQRRQAGQQRQLERNAQQ